MLALFNSLGLLEIAINNGNAADLLNLSVNSVLRIKFYD
jgi:S-adenosylmethionine hydrolase